DPKSMGPDKDRNITIQGRTYTFSLGIDGIALSPTLNYVYYSSVGSKQLWQIPTWVLRDKDSDFSGNVRLVGSKKSNADGIMFGHRGLYYGALGLNAVFKWDIEMDILSQGVSEGEVTLVTDTPVAQNWESMQWPDGFAFGNPDIENLYFITNRAHLYHAGILDFSGGQGPNFRIFRLPVNDSSYLTSPQHHFPHIGIIG
ncbi:unnamed protein product, partial [Candidula unifasciata]